MNRRSFLKRFAQAAVAVAIAPPVLSELMPMAQGGIVDSMPLMVGEQVRETILPTAIAQSLSEDYYSIRWPAKSRLWEYGTFVDESTLEARIYFEQESMTAYIPDDLSRALSRLTDPVHSVYVSEHGEESIPTRINLSEQSDQGWIKS